MKVKGTLDLDNENFDIILSIVNDEGECLKERRFKWEKVNSKTTYFLHLYGLTVCFTDITEFNSNHPLSCKIYYQTDYINL